jgi:hypothetical protein
MKGEPGKCTYSILEVKPGLCVNTQTGILVQSDCPLKQCLSLDAREGSDLVIEEFGAMPRFEA